MGVVADIVDRSPDVAREPQAYFMDAGATTPMFIVRAAAGSTATAIAARLADVVKQETGAADVSVAPMRDYARRATAPHRTRALILLGLGIAGVVLAGAGVTASLLMTVRQRTQEIGLLFALGAGAGDVRRIITRACARAATAGTVCGLVAAGVLAHLLRSIFFGVAPISVFAVGLTLAALMAVAVIAAIVPVTLAARIAPSQVLRG
jgi:putative ABC transport system permease protein